MTYKCLNCLLFQCVQGSAYCAVCIAKKPALARLFNIKPAPPKNKRYWYSWDDNDELIAVVEAKDVLMADRWFQKRTGFDPLAAKPKIYCEVEEDNLDAARLTTKAVKATE